MEVSLGIVIAAFSLCMCISLAYPFAKALSEGMLLWAFIYPSHLWRVSWRKNREYFLPKSIVTSIGGVLLSMCRTIKFRVTLAIHRDSVAPTRDTLVRLVRVSGTSNGNLIVMVPGTWFDLRDLQKSSLCILLERLKVDHPDCRIFLAPWFAVNNQETRKRAASKLAELIANEMRGGDVVSLIGHSHGGTIAAAAAALLPQEKVNAVVTVGTPFIKELDTGVLKRRISNLALELTGWIVFADACVSYFAEMKLRGHFKEVGLWASSAYRWRLIAFFALGAFLFVGSLIAFGSRKKKWVPVKYFSGPRFIAIVAKEDWLLGFMAAVSRMQRAWWAIHWRIEISQIREDRSYSWRKKHLFSVLQTVACLAPVFVAVALLPAFRDRAFEAEFIIGFSLFFSGFAAHLIPHPYIAMFGRFAVSMASVIVRLVPSLLSRLVYGAPLSWLQPGLHLMVDGSSLGATVVLVSVGKISNVHTQMLGFPKVTELVSCALRRPA